jgi:hypothetical protein
MRFQFLAIVADMGYRKSTRLQLDALVVNVELALVSIIQGWHYPFSRRVLELP